MATYIKTLKEDNGDITYPETLASAVYVTGGGDVETALSSKATTASVSNKIDKGDVQTSDIASSAVTTAKIDDGAVTTAKIADDNVTKAKLAPAFIDELYYKANDTITNSNTFVQDGDQCIFSGFLTSANKAFLITIPVQKRLDNITTATINNMYGWARVQGSYLTGMNNNANIVPLCSNIRTSVHPETNSITVCFTHSTGWGATNNSTGSFAVSAFQITLT